MDLLDQTLRAQGGRILAALIARIGDFQLAEDALQDAAASALVHWARSGPPARPEAWLIRVAFRKAIDRLRRRQRDRAAADALAVLARDETEEEPMIGDDRLRLIFTCCHPALDAKSRIALTLRSVAGLTTAEIARAFLDSESTMAQRLTRARSRLRETGIAFAVPDPEDWDQRLHSVLSVIYLIFNAGYTAGPGAPRDLCGEAIFLARLLDQLRPDQAEVLSCLALMLLAEARATARHDAEGALCPPERQDRRLWDHALMAEALALLTRATVLSGALGGPMRWKATIAAAHVLPPQPDWPVILDSYDRLFALEPTPVVALNRAVAVMEARGPAAALAQVLALAPDLPDYQPFHATLAEIHARLGNLPAARAAFDLAIRLAPSLPDALYLSRRRAALTRPQADGPKFT